MNGSLCSMFYVLWLLVCVCVCFLASGFWFDAICLLQVRSVRGVGLNMLCQWPLLPLVSGGYCSVCSSPCMLFHVCKGRW